jgi:hypothetical protein
MGTKTFIRPLARLAVVFVLASAHPAWATPTNLPIAPGKSVGLVALGTSPAEVRQAWGPPSAVKHPETSYVIWSYDRSLATVHIRDSKMIQIQTSSPVFRTPQGVGPGSPREHLVRAYGRPTWIDNLGPVTIYTCAKLGLLASFRNDDQSYVAGMSVLLAPVTR